MARRLFAALLVGALSLTPVAAQSQTSFTVAGGLTAPVSDLGDFADIGYHLAAGVNLGMPLMSYGFRLEGAYDGLSLKNGSGDVRIISGTANIVANVGATRDAPYVIVGIGAYNRNFSNNAFGYGDGKTAVGINGGGGLRFPLGTISTYFEARYHVMLGNSTEGTNYQFIPITFGINF
ncbi:MAG: hypothetical protein JWM95_3738 [Gemmatimonadetes bacterium]|nr:hypothetical protein [Gemmatimonadota bacterium]